MNKPQKNILQLNPSHLHRLACSFLTISFNLTLVISINFQPSKVELGSAQTPLFSFFPSFFLSFFSTLILFITLSFHQLTIFSLSLFIFFLSCFWLRCYKGCILVLPFYFLISLNCFVLMLFVLLKVFFPFFVKIYQVILVTAHRVTGYVM